MIRSSSSGMAWPSPMTIVYGWAGPASSPSSGATSTRTSCPGRGPRAVHREPGGLFLADPAELLVHRSLGHRGDRTRQAEAADALELHVGAHLDEQLELDGAAVLELEIAYGGVGDRLEGLGLAGGFPALANDFLEDRLADGLAEPLPDDRGRRLALAEAGEPGAGRVVLHGRVLCLAHPIDGNRDPQRLRRGVFGGFFDQDIRHAGESSPVRDRWADARTTPRPPRRAQCRAATRERVIGFGPFDHGRLRPRRASGDRVRLPAG